MRLDVRVEGGKDRVPSEIGTEPDRVGVRAREDVPTPLAAVDAPGVRRL